MYTWVGTRARKGLVSSSISSLDQHCESARAKKPAGRAWMWNIFLLVILGCVCYFNFRYIIIQHKKEIASFDTSEKHFENIGAEGAAATNSIDGHLLLGPKYSKSLLPGHSLLHTLRTPRQISCTSNFSARPRPSPKIIILMPSMPQRESSSSNRHQVATRNYLMQSMYRSLYRYIEEIGPSEGDTDILNSDTISEIERLDDDDIGVVMLKLEVALFVLPPEVLTSRFMQSGKRLLVSSSRACDLCYCSSHSSLALWFLNASRGFALEFSLEEAGTSPFLSGSLMIGYKRELLLLVRASMSARPGDCLDLRVAAAFKQLQATASIGVDYSSLVFGAVSTETRWREDVWNLNGGARQALSYKHHTTQMRKNRNIALFPYPPIVYITNWAKSASNICCAPSAVRVYNSLASVAMQKAMAPYLLNRFDEHFLGINSRKRAGFFFEKPRLVASLTSIPARFPQIEDTIRSLLDQDIKLDAVYLNVPQVHNIRFGNSSRNELPVSLIKLQDENSIFHINRNCSDYGPATKLIPTLELESNPETLIITVDDDMIFKPSAVRTLVMAHINSPDTAFTNAGQVIDFASDGPVSSLGLSVRSADKWKDGVYPIDILEAFMGAIYRRDFFDLDSLKQIPKECLYTDDIWISGNLALRGIPRVKLLLNSESRPSFSKNDNINALRENNAPLACGRDCNAKKSDERGKTISYNRNDICAKYLLRSHFFPYSEPKQRNELFKQIYGTDNVEIDVKKYSPLFIREQHSLMGNLKSVSNSSAYPPRRYKPLYFICPFEFNLLEADVDRANLRKQCDPTSDDIYDRLKVRQDLIRSLDNQWGEKQVMDGDRLGNLTLYAFQSVCSPPREY